MSDPRDAEIERLKAERDTAKLMLEHTRDHLAMCNRNSDGVWRNWLALAEATGNTDHDSALDWINAARAFCTGYAKSLGELTAERDRWRELATRFRQCLTLFIYPDHDECAFRNDSSDRVSQACRDFDAMAADCPLHHPHSGPHPIPGVPHLYAHSRIETTGPAGGVRMEGLYWERKAGE